MKTFGTWLEQFQGDASPIGDLADDFLHDCYSSGLQPCDYKTADAVRKRMVRLGACRQALVTLAEASRQYSQLKGRKSAMLDKEAEDVLGFSM